MTPKYSVGDDRDATEWRSETRHVLATWSTNPFVGIKHRYETVEQRLVVEFTPGVGVDILHEARSEDSAKFPDEEWALVESIEVRDGRARYDRRDRARWLA